MTVAKYVVPLTASLRFKCRQNSMLILQGGELRGTIPILWPPTSHSVGANQWLLAGGNDVQQSREAKVRKGSGQRTGNGRSQRTF